MSRTSEMQELVDRWKASGLSQRAFTEQQGIAYSRFQYWRRRLLAAERSGAGKRKVTSTQFSPVRIVPDAEPARFSLPFELRTTGGLSLTVPVGFDELELRRLLDVLVGC